MKKSKKGQMVVSDAPSIILVVGLVFLVMATMAFIGQKYGDSLYTDNTAGSAINETLTTVTYAGEYLSVSNLKNALCSVTTVTNATDGVVIPSTNYTATNCLLAYSGGATTYNNTNWNVTYTYTYSAQTVAVNVTGDLETEISNNTSIAGIILTISLVGIVLAILVGVFMGMGRRGMRI